MTRARGVRTPLPPGTLVGRPANGGKGAAQVISTNALATSLLATGVFGVPGGSGLSSIADSRIIANISGGAAIPTANTLTAILDHILGSTEGQIIQRGASVWQVLAPGIANQVLSSGGAAALNAWSGLSALLDAVFGSTEGDILQRGTSAWQVLAPGTVGQVLKSGGAGALNSWATPSAGSFNNRGKWSNIAGYNPFDVVQYEGSSYLNFAAVTAPTSNAPALDGSSKGTNNGNVSSQAGGSLTTTAAGVVVLVSFVERGSTPSETITSITQSGGTALTWTQRAQYLQGSGNFRVMEIWTAPSSAAISGVTFTANYAGLVDQAAVITFGIKNCSGVDPNVSLPAGPNTNTSQTISTSLANTFVIYASASDQGSTAAQGTPSGFTDIQNAQATGNFHPSNLRVSYEVFSSIQSGLVISGAGGTSPDTYADAFDGNGVTPNIPPDEDSAHWIAQGNTYAPGGRLSLSSGVAVQTADVVGGTTIYYVPYVHRGLGHLGLDLAAQISLALDSNAAHTGYHQSGKNFDIFVDGSTGTPRLVTGPAWTSDTARSAAIDQTTIPGLWSNTATMTTKFDTTASTYSAPAGTLLFVGAFRATANGQTTCQFNPAAAAGGSNTIVGLHNAYNRVRGSAISQDNTASWTYNTATWRAMNASNSNRVNYLDSLGQSSLLFLVEVLSSAGANNAAQYGLVLNSTTATPAQIGYNGMGGGSAYIIVPCIGEFIPALGYNYYQAMEFCSDNLAANTMIGLQSGNQFQTTLLFLEY